MKLSINIFKRENFKSKQNNVKLRCLKIIFAYAHLPFVQFKEKIRSKII